MSTCDIVVVTTPFLTIYELSRLIKVPIRVPLMEHELRTHPKHLGSPSISGVGVNQSICSVLVTLVHFVVIWPYDII